LDLCHYNSHVFEERHYYSTYYASAITILHLFEEFHYVRPKSPVATCRRIREAVYSYRQYCPSHSISLTSLTCGTHTSGISQPPTPSPPSDSLSHLALAAPLWPSPSPHWPASGRSRAILPNAPSSPSYRAATGEDPKAGYQGWSWPAALAAEGVRPRLGEAAAGGAGP
jgi:hypothetical protein